jgi:energy-coupling factor transport system permease protein
MKFAYKNKKTFIHRVHPACKLIWVIGILFASIVISDPLLLLVIFLSTIPFVIIGKIFKEWFSFMKIILWLSFFIIIINIFASQNGSTILYIIPGEIPLVGKLKITFEALVFGIGMSFRLMATISAFAIITLTINPDDLLQTFISFKFPYRTVFTTAVATRFIPCFLTDVDTMTDSLRTRAYDFNDGNILQRTKKRSALILPLLSNSLERAIQSAESMESRAFGYDTKRTIYKKIETTSTDYFLIILSTLFLVFLFLMWLFNIGVYNYYPSLDPIYINVSYLIIVVVLIFFILAPAFFSPLKKVIDLD